MRGAAAARMTVRARREPLPVEVVEERLAGPGDRALILHNGGYTEDSFKRAVATRDWLASIEGQRTEAWLKAWREGTLPKPKRVVRKRSWRWAYETPGWRSRQTHGV